jgi:hypothetical protein
MSFFNHETLADIINELGNKGAKDRLINYSEEFKEFCKRKVFEVEPGCYPCGQYLKQRKSFAVVLPTGEKRLQNLEDAVSIKEMLSDVLGIPLATLHLHRIDRGSVILVFSVPDSIAEELFPLPKEKVTLLKVKGMVLFVPQDLKPGSNQAGYLFWHFFKLIIMLIVCTCRWKIYQVNTHPQFHLVHLESYLSVTVSQLQHSSPGLLYQRINRMTPSLAT